MVRILLESKNDNLIISYGDSGNVNGHTKDTLDKDFNWCIFVDNKEIKRQLSHLDKIRKDMLIDI